MKGDEWVPKPGDIVYSVMDCWDLSDADKTVDDFRRMLAGVVLAPKDGDPALVVVYLYDGVEKPEGKVDWPRDWANTHDWNAEEWRPTHAGALEESARREAAEVELRRREAEMVARLAGLARAVEAAL
jgi:hypothetical protein